MSQKKISLAVLGVTAMLLPRVVLAGAGAQALASFVEVHILNQATIAFTGLAAAALFYYGFRMIFESGKDEAYSNVSNAFLYAFIGFCVLACAGAIAIALTTNLSSDSITDISPLTLKGGIQSVANFIITLAQGVFILIAVLAGLRMASSQGEQGEFDKWRKVFIANCIGVMIMVIAQFIVNGVDLRDPMTIVEELRGIALFFLTIIGFFCVIALIVAGVMLIVSIDEGLRDRAKRIIIGTLITLAIVICSYAIIRSFVFSPSGSSSSLL